MTTRNTLAALSAITIPILVSCASSTERAISNTQPSDPQTTIIVDGDTSEWTQGPGLVATPSELIVHFQSHDRTQAIQAADFTTRIRIDSDSDMTTGKRMITTALTSNVAHSLGVEIQAQLSPSTGFGNLRSGSSAARFTPKGETIESGHADLGFYFLPTHNAPSYEARFDRERLESLQHTGPVVVAVDALDRNGNVIETRRFETTLPEFAPREPTLSAIPTKQGTRVMSINVLRSTPITEPEPFARLFRAVDPDIILSQEWFGTDRARYQQWFDEHTSGSWNHAAPSRSSGVAISSRHPITRTWTMENSDTRAIFALVDAPNQPILCVSIHLKCCGGAQSHEDVKRFNESNEINARIESIRRDHPSASVLIAGDYNLVGTRRPLEVLATRLALDESDLTPAHTVLLDHSASITWNDPDSSFSPGRLDWILYDDPAHQARRAFTIDTELLSQKLLDRSDLDPLDSRASDHLPLIVDLTPRP